MPRAALTLVALAMVVASTGCQTVRGAWDLATGNTALVNVARMEDADSPDQRRRGINYLVARVLVSVVAGLASFLLNAIVNFRQL